MTKKTVTSGFVLSIILHCAPEQTSAASPAIKHDSVDERLISRSHNERVVLVRLFWPGRAPMQRERLKTKFFQFRADVVRVVGADAAFFHANMNQVIVNRWISDNAILVSALARHVMRSLR